MCKIIVFLFFFCILVSIKNSCLLQKISQKYIQILVHKVMEIIEKKEETEIKIINGKPITVIHYNKRKIYRNHRIRKRETNKGKRMIYVYYNSNKWKQLVR